MRKANYDWQINEVQIPEEFQQILTEQHLSILLGKLLWKRGIQTREEIQAFFHPGMDQLHDPFLLHDMEKATERIQHAIVTGERILVYGDYDADGITSTTIMKETLELLGADVEAFLPNRFKQGYGPNKELYEQKIQEGIQLIITVDNGVAGHEAIEAAQQAGVDVIVTDHHELPTVLPSAFAIIHPRHPEGKYPFGDLAGAGVAFKVATALLEEVPEELLDLAAIGTIADLVSLQGENRSLVAMGLQAIKQTERIGLHALFAQSGQKLEEVNEGTIGFTIAPRLNAIGRLGDPNPAVTLLSTFDEEEAQQLAQELDTINDERKQIVADITDEALAMVDPKNQVHLIAHQGWHEGVLGIVAGRILEETGKPAILLTLKEDGSAKGSGRSVDALNIYEMLDQMRDLFTHFGGHHAAVGLTLPAENLSILQDQMNQYIAMNQIDLTKGSKLLIDEILTPKDVTIDFIQDFKRLAPFGTSNPLPQFLFKQVTVQNVKQIGAQKNHLKFSIVQGDQLVDSIAFGLGAEAGELGSDPIDVVGQLSINEWNGRRNPQLSVKDFSVLTVQIFDRRAKRYWTEEIKDKAMLSIVFNPDALAYLNDSLKEKTIVFQTVEQIVDQMNQVHYDSLVVGDSPLELEQLKAIIQAGDFSRIYLLGISPDEAYIDGLGTREQYARLFKFIQTQDQVDIRYKLPAVAQYIKIPEKLLIFMIKVFFDLKFVTIENGVLRKVPNPQNHPLTDSNLYQQRKDKIKSEEFLLLSDIPAIKTWLAI
ncbi:MAG: single-stranded-DNA-specific exonuclease RecJ [Enterococcus sp.]